jgi:hypothetical protein
VPAQIAPGAPQGRMAKTYRSQEVDGVEVFLPPGLVLVGPALVIGLGGFWRWRWLVLDGVGQPFACAG